MSLHDDLAEVEATDDPTMVALATHEKVKRDNTRLKMALGREQAATEDVQHRLDVLLNMTNTVADPPAWAMPKKKKDDHKGIVSLFVSDCHFDEVVEPGEIDGLNAYNRDIAVMRLKKTFENCIMLSRDYLSGLDYEGCSLFLGGDMVTGTIHEELAQSNEAFMPETILFWIDQLAAGIHMLHEEYGKVHISGVVGNHGRNTRKPRMKGRVRDNWDWLIYKLLARDFANVPGITFQIPESADCVVELYNTKFLFTHGDQFRGGSGISGILAPLMRGDHRKRKRHMETDMPYDYMLMGHFHQYMNAKRVLVNGTNKGYDEYAYMGNFDFEPPQQAFWITTPEHGPTLHAPIFTQNRKAEGW